MKFGQDCEIWLMVDIVKLGMVWFGLEGSKSTTMSQSVSQSVTKVGIELLGQLKNRQFGPEGLPLFSIVYFVTTPFINCKLHA